MHKLKHPKQKESITEFIIDVLMNAAVIIAVFLLVQYFIAAPFQVVGNSMLGTLHDGEYIIVSKLEYLFGQPQKGDIIVFHPPQNREEYYIKRIIGVPGDTVRLKEGTVFVNGLQIEESYLDNDQITCVIARLHDCPSDNKVYKIPEGSYFVLGDNRQHSSDSRAWYDDHNTASPFVTRNQIQGKTRLVLYPLPDIRIIPQTTVFAGL